MAYVCVVSANTVYFMGGQLVFDWDWLENFLITCDRPVGNIVTNTKRKRWVSHVQMQCTIGLVSDAQTEGKMSVTPKSWLSRNNRKTYYNTFAASAKLASGQPSQEAPKNIRGQPVDGKIVCTFWNIDWKMFFFGSLSIQCKIRCNPPSDTNRPSDQVDAINLLAIPGLFQCLNCISFG